MTDASPASAGDGPKTIETIEGLRRLLFGCTELEALERLHGGDPLRLSSHAYQWMKKRCYFLDRSLLAQQAQTLVAARVGVLDGEQDLETFTEGILEDAARLLMRAEERQATLDEVVPEPYEPRFVMLMENLGVEPNQLWRAVVTINSLPTGQRHVFHNCWVQGGGFGRYEQEFGVGAARVQELFLKAVDAISDVIDGSENHG